MNEVGILKAHIIDNNPLEEDIETYRSEFDASYKNYEKSYKFNQWFNISFTALSIVLTMLLAIVGVSGDSAELFGIPQKVWVGIIGAAAVAVQTAATQFPVNVRAKKYLELRNSVRELKLDLSLAEKTDDLKTIKGKYVELLKLESAVP